jgi:hypothetical protein
MTNHGRIVAHVTAKPVMLVGQFGLTSVDPYLAKLENTLHKLAVSPK